MNDSTLLKEPLSKKAVQEKYSFAAEFLASIHPVSERYKDILRDCTYFRKLKKGELLVKKGEVCTFICFIRKGLIRGFIEYEKTDITTWISCENELVTSITGFFKNNPAKENIQAIEPCLIECIDAKDLAYLYEECPEAHIVTRLILEKYYEDAENRALISRLPSLAEKYKYLHSSDSYRHILQRAPLKYVASFLSVRQETLSRLRGKVTKGGIIKKEPPALISPR
jgi:CRP-like cAMP-binding protein